MSRRGGFSHHGGRVIPARSTGHYGGVAWSSMVRYVALGWGSHGGVGSRGIRGEYVWGVAVGLFRRWCVALI